MIRDKKELFYDALCCDHKVNPDHKGVRRAFWLAWDHGHACGKDEVENYFIQFLDIVDDTEEALGRPGEMYDLNH